jgi:hypothetical protein
MQWTLEATRPGYLDYREQIRFEEDEAKVPHTIRLQPIAPVPDRSYEVPPGFRGFPGDDAPARPKRPTP